MPSDLFKVPNLLTLGRLILLAPTAYFLSRPEPQARLYALFCLSIAAITDYFDGYFARKLNQKTELGLILDPLTDKILAAVLVVLLIRFRAFPLWLAAAIIGRDLLIAAGGFVIKSRYGILAASNLTGKYCFSAIAVLLVSYIIEFQFGILMMTYLAIILMVVSLAIYVRRFVTVVGGKQVSAFQDRPLYFYLRVGLMIAVIIIYLFKLGQFIGWI
jgi:CDP-diacylglycerol--glycerol-3-phosphate 3-phosphatidyltransferase